MLFHIVLHLVHRRHTLRPARGGLHQSELLNDKLQLASDAQVLFVPGCRNCNVIGLCSLHGVLYKDCHDEIEEPEGHNHNRQRVGEEEGQTIRVEELVADRRAVIVGTPVGQANKHGEHRPRHCGEEFLPIGQSRCLITPHHSGQDDCHGVDHHRQDQHDPHHGLQSSEQPRDHDGEVLKGLHQPHKAREPHDAEQSHVHERAEVHIIRA
mmetsp:Transcript_3810/g.10128  ORF Transcript_3810/g.10128 Transcript_3810/m.10128 type:complete len:210 (+) Transcript_3810:625-1254(+)